MEKKEKERIISKEQIEVINKIINKKAAEAHSTKEEGQKIDYEKIMNALRSLEGMDVYTVMNILGAAMLLLPSSTVLNIIKIGKQVFRTKSLVESLKKRKIEA